MLTVIYILRSAQCDVLMPCFLLNWSSNSPTSAWTGTCEECHFSVPTLDQKHRSGTLGLLLNKPSRGIAHSNWGATDTENSEWECSRLRAGDLEQQALEPLNIQEGQEGWEWGLVFRFVFYCQCSLSLRNQESPWDSMSREVCNAG